MIASRQDVKVSMTRLVRAFIAEGIDGDDVALDIIEHIARRMADRDDCHVKQMGFFVRTVLLNYILNHLGAEELISRLSVASIVAPLGHAALNRVIFQGMKGCVY